MSTELEIESWEDRSYQDKPNSNSFGFVYFNDGSRVGYSPGVARTGDVWQPQTNGGGQFVEVTPKHLKMARDLLKEEGVLS